jgi:hypothetical protein
MRCRRRRRLPPSPPPHFQDQVDRLACHSAVGSAGGLTARCLYPQIDTFTLARRNPPPSWVHVDTSGSTRPVQTYGHTTTMLPTTALGGKHVLATIGGVMYGGYQGDVGDLSLLEFRCV